MYVLNTLYISSRNIYFYIDIFIGCVNFCKFFILEVDARSYLSKSLLSAVSLLEKCKNLEICRNLLKGIFLNIGVSTTALSDLYIWFFYLNY